MKREDPIKKELQLSVFKLERDIAAIKGFLNRGANHACFKDFLRMRDRAVIDLSNAKKELNTYLTSSKK